MSNHYELTVWRLSDGEIVKKLWDADQADYDEVIEEFGDDPECHVVIDKEWWEDLDQDEDLT